MPFTNRNQVHNEHSRRQLCLQLGNDIVSENELGLLFYTEITFILFNVH